MNGLENIIMMIGTLYLFVLGFFALRLLLPSDKTRRRQRTKRRK